MNTHPHQHQHNPYNSPILDEIHHHFPALLYANTQFNTVPDVMNYITGQMQQQFDIFTTNRNRYLQQQADPTTPQRQRQQQQQQRPNYEAAAPSAPSRPPRRLSSVRQQPTTTTAHIDLDLSNDEDDEMTGAAQIINMVNTLLGNTGAPIRTRTYTFPVTALEPVEVFPSPEQLRTNTTVSVLSENASDLCSVCQDSMLQGATVRKINLCGHTFHKHCVDIWFQRNVHCPTCRHDVRE